MIDRFLVPRSSSVSSCYFLVGTATVWPGASFSALLCFFANRHFPPPLSSARSIDRSRHCLRSRSFIIPLPYTSPLPSPRLLLNVVFGHHNIIRTKNDDDERRDDYDVWHWHDTHATQRTNVTMDTHARTHGLLGKWIKLDWIGPNLLVVVVPMLTEEEHGMGDMARGRWKLGFSVLLR
ncbi:hypothetical protein IWZ01DRAFT_332982 [Phyllosticta capitalensis]